MACFAVVAGCAGAPNGGPASKAIADTKAPPESPAACQASLELRFRAGPLRDAGRLERAMRVLEQADRLCTKTAVATWSIQVGVLADLGQVDAALALAARIDASSEAAPATKAAAAKARADIAVLQRAPADAAAAERDAAKLYREGLDLEKVDAKLARERFLAAWKARHPFGEALLHAGLAAKQEGAIADAQRLFDRALFEIERSSGKRATVDVPNGFDVGSAVAFRPDGEAVAVGHGRDVVLLAADDLEERLRFEGHRERVASVAFSNDGKWIAAGSADPALRVWDATTGAIHREYLDFKDEVNAVAFSRDGKYLGAVSGDGWVQVWNAQTGEAVFRLDEGEPLFAIAFAPGSDRLAVGGASGRIRIRALPKGEPVATLVGHKAGLVALAFSADGKKLVSGSIDRTVKVWDAATKRAVHTLTGFASALAVARDGKAIAFGTKEHAIALWDADSGAPRGSLQGHAGEITAAAFAPDGNRLLTCAEDRVDLLWDVGKSKTLVAIEGHGKALASVAFSPIGDRLVAVARDRRALSLGGAAPNGFAVHEIRPDVTPALAVSPDGKLAATATSERVIEIWDTDSGRTRSTIAVHDDAVTSLAFHPNGKVLATASADKTVNLVDVATGQVLGKIDKHKGPVRGVAFSPDGRFLATASADFDARIWGVPKRDSLFELEHGYQHEVTSVAFSPESMRLATASHGDTLWLWTVDRGQTIFTVGGPPGAVRQVAFSSDGRAVAAASSDGAARVYSASTGKYLRRLSASRASIEGVAYSPKRDLLAAASADGSIFLFAPEAGELVATVRPVAGSQGAYVFSTDGRFEALGERVADLVIVCRVGGKSFPFSLCEDRATTPGLLSKILAGDRSSSSEP